MPQRPLAPSPAPDASLLYLKHAYKLSDEELVERWAENVVWQHFSGMRFYEPHPPCDATQIGRFRSAIGEAGVEELLKATIDNAVASNAIKPAEFERLIVDATVQEKAIAHPVDSRLLEIACHKVVAAAKRAGIALEQTFVKEGKSPLFCKFRSCAGFHWVNTAIHCSTRLHECGSTKELRWTSVRWRQRRLEGMAGHLPWKLASRRSTNDCTPSLASSELDKRA